jgi:hypothetical protein
MVKIYRNLDHGWKRVFRVDIHRLKLKVFMFCLGLSLYSIILVGLWDLWDH